MRPERRGTMSNYHVPVLLQECINGLNIKPGGVYVDVTYGGGGHSKALLNNLNENGLLLAFDQDADAVKNRVDDARLKFCNANFRYLENFCAYYRVDKVDGILADLGVSSHQFNEGDRGFSFRFEDADLDMRMNAEAEVSAKEILNSYDQISLTKLLKEYGELNGAQAFARSICEYRKLKPIEKVEDLESAVAKHLSGKFRNKQLAQVYQAIRIEVNGEMSALKEMLSQSADLLAPGGRLVVMSYHSLEDRLVKNLINTGNLEGERIVDAYGNADSLFKAVNRKPIVASEEELQANPRARSAKLRIAERI